MNRVIKFRVWDKREKEMIPPEGLPTLKKKDIIIQSHCMIHINIVKWLVVCL